MSNANNIYIDTDNRLFYISDGVDHNSMGKACYSLLSLLQKDEKTESEQKNFKRQPIKIFINSFGGSMYDMWALIDIITTSQTPIYTYCTGYAMSAGFLIFLAGHKRFVTKHATLMCHQLSMWDNGKLSDMQQVMEEREENQRDIEDFIIKQTKITQERLDEIRIKKIDWYIKSTDVEKLGIAEVI
jgi:ATP-dependent Clp protease protease subunit